GSDRDFEIALQDSSSIRSGITLFLQFSAPAFRQVEPGPRNKRLRISVSLNTNRERLAGCDDFIIGDAIDDDALRTSQRVAEIGLFLLEQIIYVVSFSIA